MTTLSLKVTEFSYKLL